MVFDVLTIFPHLLDSYLEDSILWREQKKKIIKIRFHDIRAYSKDKHKKVDDTPYGGGAGMVMTPQPIFDCMKAAKRKNRRAPVIYLTPTGKLFDYKMAKRLAKKPGLILLCGRYEGIDERIRKLCVDEEISIGNYVLTGGELPAMVIIDAITRLLPGALGDERSAHEDSFTEALNGKKEYPHYTKPREFQGLKVPPILLTGDHAKINAWRKKKLK
ncbi:tRNA (guanosine(37)-N1)-methyltransferase TrmD [Candidatus Peregrinibacteria bacterium]|nr:tRNA (guanosine(37)-N1)-methyltransferase TrmD [Candidatus Peregrinibacteria bacterium]